MYSLEDRVAAVERKVAAMELERLYDERKRAENTPPQQALNLKEINEHLTILLGIASGQERDIKIVKKEVGVIRERVERLEERIDEVHQQLNGRFDDVDRRFDGMEQRFTSMEEKFERMLQQLAALTTKSE